MIATKQELINFLLENISEDSIIDFSVSVSRPKSNDNLIKGMTIPAFIEHQEIIINCERKI